MSYEDAKDAINDNIYANGDQEIKGNILNGVLLAMLNYCRDIIGKEDDLDNYPDIITAINTISQAISVLEVPNLQQVSDKGNITSNRLSATQVFQNKTPEEFAQYADVASNVVFSDSFDDLPSTGESGKIYITEGKIYFWNGSNYEDLLNLSNYTQKDKEETIEKKWEFEKNIKIPKGTEQDEAVNLEQLDEKPNLDDIKDGEFEVKGVGALEGGGTMTANQDNDTNASLDLTQETKDNIDKGVDAYDHISKTNNPHNVTKSQVGLGNVDNTSDVNKPISNPQQAALDGKVDKETGKSLVDDDEIEKLENIEEGAQKNVQSDYAELDAELDSFIKNKESYIDIIDEFTFYEGDSQMFKLNFDLFKLLNVDVNGYGLVKSQMNQWHNAVEILDELEAPEGREDEIRIHYQTPTDYSRIHGFRFDITVGAPEVERIGNPDMETELPIQSQMRGCIVQDNGKINYWLDADDWQYKEDGSTPSDLSGADGQVMVRVPRYWMKDTQKGNIRTVLFSDKPFEGATEFPEIFIGAYKAALDRSNNILASVMNESGQYRGGNNQSAWDKDNQWKSQLGKPATVKSRIDFREYAENRGENWHIVDIVAHTSVAWLATYEFGTRNHQDAITDGPVNLNSTKWSEFNSRYPIFKCGLSNSLGNGTGKVTLDISDVDLGVEETEVFRYRGIENWWGDIYEWMSGVNVINNKYYMTNGKLESNTNSDGYQEIGDRPTSNGYIQEMHPGTLLPKSNSGSSSTYYADYLHANDTTSIRGLLRSYHANVGAHAGSFVLNSHVAPSDTDASRGSRLCFSKR